MCDSHISLSEHNSTTRDTAISQKHIHDYSYFDTPVHTHRRVFVLHAIYCLGPEQGAKLC